MSTSRDLWRRCLLMAEQAGFHQHLAGPHDFHVWQRSFDADATRWIQISRPPPFGLRADESSLGHLGDPDEPYWSLAYASKSDDRKGTIPFGVKFGLTLAQAFALARGLEEGTAGLG